MTCKKGLPTLIFFTSFIAGCLVILLAGTDEKNIENINWLQQLYTNVNGSTDLLFFDVPNSVIGSVLVMFIYFLSSLFFGKIACEVDKYELGDSIYYLGFLFTLVALAISLTKFSAGGELKPEVIPSIVSQSGIALLTTVAGLLLRAWLVQFNTNVDDKVSQASNDAIQTLNSLSSSVEKAQNSLIKSFNELQLSHSRSKDLINGSSEVFDQSIQKISNNLSSVNIPNDLFLEKMTPVISQFLDQIKSMTDDIKENNISIKETGTTWNDLNESAKKTNDIVDKRVKIFDELGEEILKNKEEIKSLTQAINEASKVIEKINTIPKEYTDNLTKSSKAVKNNIEGLLNSLNKINQRMEKATDKASEHMEIVHENIVNSSRHLLDSLKK